LFITFAAHSRHRHSRHSRAVTQIVIDIVSKFKVSLFEALRESGDGSKMAERKAGFSPFTHVISYGLP